MNRGYGISMDEKHLPEFCYAMKNTLEQNRAKILSFPYLSEQKDLRFIMWSLISRIVWDFTERVNRVLAKTYFSDITPLKRNFSCVAVAYTDEQHPAFDFYGCDRMRLSLQKRSCHRAEDDFNDEMGMLIEQIAGELSTFMRTHIPKHLLNEYPVYTILIAGIRILSKAIEECIAAGILSTPESRIGAEGMLMIVEK